MRTLGEQFPELPDVFYSGRIFYSKPFGHLAAAGLIEAAGNLNRMRFSEVRLAPIRARLTSAVARTACVVPPGLNSF